MRITVRKFFINVSFKFTPGAKLLSINREISPFLTKKLQKILLDKLSRIEVSKKFREINFPELKF